MEVTLAILRGINVSGHKTIRMADLKALLEEAGFKQVTTYIQSGNIVFLNHPGLLPDLPTLIAQKIYERYNFEVPVITRTLAQMRNLLTQNPWLTDNDLDPDKLHVTFLAEMPAPASLDKIAGIANHPDKFVIQGQEVFLYCPDGYGNTKLNNTFFEKKLKVTATTRNWRTVNELYRIMQTYETTT